MSTRQATYFSLGLDNRGRGVPRLIYDVPLAAAASQTRRSGGTERPGRYRVGNRLGSISWQACQR
jgi:hypothetical protein